jgi:hypothetical protein
MNAQTAKLPRKRGYGAHPIVKDEQWVKIPSNAPRRSFIIAQQAMPPNP